MANLQLALKGEYFDDIKNGIKVFEFREVNDYWSKRLVNRQYDKLIITRGYPSKDDLSKKMIFDYCGYELQTITHKHFGNIPINVYAIIIRKSN
jgi:hypothetical protein